MVARRSPQTERIVQIMSLLGSRPPDDGMTMSEIARRLGLTTASCYPMIDTLVAAGYLVRNPARRTYQLGPELVRLGSAAARVDDRLRQCREAMTVLSEELGMPTWLYRLDRDRLHVIDEVWTADSHWLPRIGQLYWLRPPTGAVFAAWDDDRAVEHWLELGRLAEPDRVGYRQKLQEVRKAGYAVHLIDRVPQTTEMSEAMISADNPLERWRLAGELASRPPLSSEYLVVEVDPERVYSLTSIDAPVIGADARAEFGFGVVGRRELDGATIARIGATVSEAARSISVASPDPHCP